MTPRIFAFASGKGGVGKSVLVANMARQLAKSGTEKILVIDGDFGLSSLDVMLNLRCEQNIDDFLFENVPLERLVVDTKRGFDLLPAASGTREVRELSLEQRQRLTYSLEEVSHRYDLIFIDCPPGIGRDTLQLCALSHHTVLCVTPEPTSITDTYAFIKLMREVYREKRFTIAMNMVRSGDEAFAVFQRLFNVTSDFLGVSLDYAGALVLDHRVKEAVKDRKLFVDQFPHSQPAKLAREMVRFLHELEHQPTQWNGGLKALWPMFLHHIDGMESEGLR
jgi:flagellar biosynthesis protein FlhG